MQNVSERFHALVTDDSVISRVRMYFISDSVDCTDDDDVVENGTLLHTETDTVDSNERIGEDGITLSDMFNREDDLTVGDAVSDSLLVNFMNSDGALNNFAFGRCKVYFDVYDEANSEWLPSSLGVFIFDTPVKRRVQLITATAYDQMQLFDQNADDWWNNLDFTNGLNNIGILQAMATQLGVTVHPDSLDSSKVVNSGYVYTSRPFESSEHTYRDILSMLAGSACSIARFDRNGYLCLKFFQSAEVNGEVLDIDADASPTTCVSYDLAEYVVQTIDKVQVSASNNDIGVIYGDGTNAYRFVNNEFLNGDSQEDILSRTTPLYDRLNGFGSYIPLSVNAYADPSIEAGDIISFTRDNTTYTFPIFQQNLTWRGKIFRGDIWASGSPFRTELSAVNRYEFRSGKLIHELITNAELLRSMIQDLNGNYTNLEQTVSSISRTVSSQGASITSILDKNGEIWLSITGNQTSIASLATQVNNEKAQRDGYVRIIPTEPAIVIGLIDGSVIKLKMVNNVVYFFNGSDFDTFDEANPFAYFTAQEFYDDKIVAGTSVQIGSESANNHWVFQRLNNGDLVLEMI